MKRLTLSSVRKEGEKPHSPGKGRSQGMTWQVSCPPLLPLSPLSLFVLHLSHHSLLSAPPTCIERKILSLLYSLSLSAYFSSSARSSLSFSLSLSAYFSCSARSSLSFSLSLSAYFPCSARSSLSLSLSLCLLLI